MTDPTTEPDAVPHAVTATYATRNPTRAGSVLSALAGIISGAAEVDSTCTAARAEVNMGDGTAAAGTYGQAVARAVADELDRRKAHENDTAKALGLIASRSCERSTSGPGACTRDSGWYAYARYGADQWCLPCVGWAALHGVPLTTEPTEAAAPDTAEGAESRG